MRSLLRPVLLALISLSLLARPVGASAPTVYIPPGWPKLLVIPRLQIRAPIESIALSRPQDIDAPFHWGDVAWYSRGVKPGIPGRASIFGHLDSYCCPAVFYLLRDLQKGDIVQVYYKTGPALNFRVQWQHMYPNTQLPMKFLYGRANDRGLALMTCGGVFHRDGTGYDHKLLVYASLVLPHPAAPAKGNKPHR